MTTHLHDSAGLQGGHNFEPRYDLSPAEVQGLTDDFLQSQEWPEGKFLATIVPHDHPVSNVGRTLERKVFEEAFNNDSKAMRQEYGPYEHASKFLMVFDQKDSAPAGVERVLEASDAGLKSLNDAPPFIGKTVEQIRNYHGIANLAECWDIGTLAVPQEYRGLSAGFMPSTLIYRMFFLQGKRQGIKHVVSMIDAKARKGVNILGIPLVNTHGSEAFEYLGSPENYAVYGAFPEFEPAVQQKAELLRERARITPGNLLHPKKFVTRRVAAKVAGRLATGKDLDRHIVLPPVG